MSLRWCPCGPAMGAALQPAECEEVDGELAAAAPTMADVIRERKKKAGGASLGTLRRRLAAAARRPRDARPDRGCEHGRFIRQVVSGWRPAEAWLLAERLSQAAALRDLHTQACLARPPAAALPHGLGRARRRRWWCDVELVGGGGGVGGAGWVLRAHRAVLAARCPALRPALRRGLLRVPLEGPCASLSAADAELMLNAIYCGHPAACCQDWEQPGEIGSDLDIINTEGSSSCGGCGGRGVALAAALGCSPDTAQRDMRLLLHSGEMSDCRLSWGGYELPVHRVVLAARSRYFRGVMSRVASGGTVRVDPAVLPRRFARALLTAAYTDQVDLNLIGRSPASPSPTNSGNITSAWGGTNPRGRSSASSLEDAFQLYEISRFLEMPIAVQGCEDAIVEALSPESLPAILAWAAAPHASVWVQRQAMRYLCDEFPTIMTSPAAGRLPRGALEEALSSPFLQASETQVLRAVMRWAEGGSAPRRGRRREGGSPQRDAFSTLLPLVRLHLLPPNHEPLQQLVRRGVISAEEIPTPSSSADAWLGRVACLPPARCFLPYLDELKALLQHQAPPEAELARLRRERLTSRIPDTLYMVAAGRESGAATATTTGTSTSAGGTCGGDGACVSPRLLHSMRSRVRELRMRASALHPHCRAVRLQIGMRVVREMALPDSCADLLLDDDGSEREREWESNPDRRRWEEPPPDCCRRLSGVPSSSSRPGSDLDTSRPSSCRREPPSRSSDGSRHSRGSPHSERSLSRPALSACVPDVAMAPNGNTHLLAPYCRAAEYSAGVLQLDLGDGATHTPRPGSRAARALAAARGDRTSPRAYASYLPRAPSPSAVSGTSGVSGVSGTSGVSGVSGASGVSGTGGGGGLGTLGTLPGRSRTLPARRELPPHAPHLTRIGARAGGPSLVVPHLHHTPLRGLGATPGVSPAHSPAPRHRHRYEPPYGSPPTRAPSPNDYA